MIGLFKKKKNYIKNPKPYDEVNSGFVIEGLIPKKWLIDQSSGIEHKDLSLDFISLRGVSFHCGSIQISEFNTESKKLKNFVRLHEKIYFNSNDIAWVELSKGRIAIKIYGRNEKKHSIFIPIIIKSGNDYVAPEKIVKEHESLESKLIRCRNEIEVYDRKINKIREAREIKSKIYDNEKDNQYFYLRDWNIASDILDIIQSDEGKNENYLYSDEDRAEKKLNQKYKEALEWRDMAWGPLCGAGVGAMDGYYFRVYSNDHDTHFHIIHKEKGIEARFSFPEIELLGYKNLKYTMSSKTIKKIQEYFKKPENFEKLKMAIERRNDNF